MSDVIDPNTEPRPAPVEPKFWEVEVDFPNDQTYPTKAGAARIYSYLRLGTAEVFDASTPNRGDDLADLVKPFIDDDRHRGAGDQCWLSVADRQAETAVLFTKGGWRDHSDGNRISTTRGDKVEVVRGNYRMVVLGRQDSTDKGTYYESGGGLFQEGDIQPGAVTEIRWVQDPYGGTWRCIEEATKGDTVNRYHGDVDEVYYGKKITTTVGTETVGSPPPGRGGPPLSANSASETLGREGWADKGVGEVQQANPVIIEKTWADSIESYTGSSACRVPSVKEETWVATKSELVDSSGSLSSETRAASTSEKATVSGGMTETTTAGTITNTTTVGALTETTTSGVITQTAIAGAITDIKVMGQLTEVTVGGNRTAVQAIVAMQEINISLFSELFLGTKISIIIGPELDITIGPKKEIKGLGELKTSLTDVKTALSAKVTALKVALGL